MFKKLFKKISISLQDKHGDISHTKISSYIILLSVLASSAVFLAIDITNAIQKWKADEEYVIPAAHITIFGMILGHHLFLLGIKKASENRSEKYKSLGANLGNDSTDIPTYGATEEEEG